MPRAARIALVCFFVLLAVPAATVRAATRMPVGFFDDPSFRWSPDRAQNLAAAAAAGATVIHTTANWASMAPTRPAHPADADDPAYRLGDLDELVRESARYGLRVMIDVTGTPKWANGGKTQNHMPTHLTDFAVFVHMLAVRYNGHNAGKGEVSLWSIWNEPNEDLFLTPQYSGKKIVSPANYAKLVKTAYAAIKSANPWAKIAIGETSPEGRDKPLKGAPTTVSPGMFARLLAKQPGLKFDAWAHHPYPTVLTGIPLQKVKYPNVTLSQLPAFETELKKDFHREVPIWITEYGHQTKPANPKGVTLAQQASYATTALNYARADPDVQMFIWFTFRDSTGNPWKSGLEGTTGGAKPAFFKFDALAHLIDGTTVSAAANKPMHAVSVFVPFLTFYDPLDSLVGVTYTVTDKGKLVARGEPQGNIQADSSVSFTPTFTPVKGHTYSIVATVNDSNGNVQTRMVVIVTTT
ncbi:MAG TPA: cellulase family glycosylhydrolase [Gaiellaceae bacterium]